MNSINENFETKINLLNKKIENLVSLVDKKPKFYNNIFFEENSKSIPLNLINTDYINISNENDILNEKKLNIEEDYSNNPTYFLKEPLYIFSLPSSDDSGNEDNNYDQHVSFKSICDEIIDEEFLDIINDKDKNEIEDIIKNNVFFILIFKTIPELSTIEEILNYCKYKMNILPYEIKKTYIPGLNKNSVFLVKFYSFDEAKKAKEILNNDFNTKYNVNFHLCYDKREIKDSKWYCVVFRRECIKDKNNYKFIDIINDIYDKIKCDKKNEKKIITIDMNNYKFKKSGNIFYSAIRVSNLEDALNLCIQYNEYNNLKVHLHYLTYENSEKIFPQVLTQKEYFEKRKQSLSEDENDKIFKELFPSYFNKIKRKKKKEKKNK